MPQEQKSAPHRPREPATTGSAISSRTVVAAAPASAGATRYSMFGGVILWLALLSPDSVALAAEDRFGAPPEMMGRVAADRPAGCAAYRFLFFRLFDAELWTDAAAPPGEKFALSLVYRRKFSREELISSSISEMARMSGRPEQSFASANAALERIMRDVAAGDRFTAWRAASKRVEFFHNGRAVGVLIDDASLFLDIWLGPDSRDSRRRDRLLAGDCDD